MRSTSHVFDKLFFYNLKCENTILFLIFVLYIR